MDLFSDNALKATKIIRLFIILVDSKAIYKTNKMK
jgi:hypothetical protein